MLGKPKSQYSYPELSHNLKCTCCGLRCVLRGAPVTCKGTNGAAANNPGARHVHAAREEGPACVAAQPSALAGKPDVGRTGPDGADWHHAMENIIVHMTAPFNTISKRGGPSGGMLVLVGMERPLGNGGSAGSVGLCGSNGPGVLNVG